MTTTTENIQAALRRVRIGRTSVVFGAVVTRWAKDAYEVGTWGAGDSLSSERAAEEIDATRNSPRFGL